MKRTRNHPEQLHLDLQWDYLSRLSRLSENPAYFETTSRILIEGQSSSAKRSPLWEEIANSRY